MRLNNEPETAQLWAKQRQDIALSGEFGDKFLELIEHVSVTAENHIDDTEMRADAALRHGLGAYMEESDMGPPPLAMIGPMLILLSMYWEFGEAMQEGLTVIERQVMLEALQSKIAELNDSAAAAEVEE